MAAPLVLLPISLLAVLGAVEDRLASAAQLQVLRPLADVGIVREVVAAPGLWLIGCAGFIYDDLQRKGAVST